MVKAILSYNDYSIEIHKTEDWWTYSITDANNKHIHQEFYYEDAVTCRLDAQIYIDNHILLCSKTS